MKLLSLLKETNQFYNLNIEVKGFNEFFESSDLSKRIVESKLEKIKYIMKFWGMNLATNKGIIQGYNPNLHTFKGEIDLREYPFSKPHIHLDINRIIYLDNLKEFEFSKPIYTLNGLYNIFKSKNSNEKIEILKREIKNFYPDFKFDSISQKDKTKIKILENHYKRKISNQ